MDKTHYYIDENGVLRTYALEVTGVKAIGQALLFKLKYK